MAAWQREVSSEVTSVQFGVLELLHRNPGASQRDLCQGLDLDRSTIADIASRLQKRGLIERVRDTHDRRRNVLHLTPRGSEELERLLPRVWRVEHVLTGDLSDPERAALQRLLSAVLAAPRVRDAVGTPPLTE